MGGGGAMIEFRCEGCGAFVVEVERETVPASHLCATCDWLCGFVSDPDEFWSLYLRLVRGEAEGAEPCVPGSTGFEMGSSSGGSGGKPSDSSNQAH
jgi:hypothetical protein